MHVKILHIDPCPNWRTAWERLAALAEAEGFTLEHHTLHDPDDPAWEAFAGSPTILVGGRDPFPASPATGAWACRVYATPEGPRGAPTTEQLAAAIREARRDT